MIYMNEWDITDANRIFATCQFENLQTGARILERLADWTNRNSDGWPYWSAPHKASAKLQRLLSENLSAWEDCTAQELASALTPVKAFLTRQGVAHEEVIAA